MVTPSSLTGASEAAATRSSFELAELQVTDLRWQALVAGHPDALAFHRPVWAEAVAESYGHRAFVLAALDDSRQVVGGLPVIEVRSHRRRPRWVALPFTDTCPPLLSPGVDGNGFATALVAACADAQVGRLELRAALSQANGAYRFSDAVTHTTTLEAQTSGLFARLNRSQVQRNIRRAEREAKLVIRRGDDRRDLIESFYRLHTQTRHRLGMPVQPRRFFDVLWSQVISPGYGFVLLAEAEGNAPVAAAVFLAGTRTLTYKYGASDAASWKLRPNHLLFWRALCSACEEGYTYFDWGRSDLADEGLRSFKSGWAAEESSLVYTTIGETPPAAGSGRALAAARVVLRRSPALACRVAGELLYRFAA